MDDLKLWMARLHCGKDPRCINDDLEYRDIVVAFLKDSYDRYHTIVVSLAGSPPKAQALLFPLVVDWHPEKMEDSCIPIGTVLIHSLGKTRFKHAPIKGWYIDLSEFFERKDCIVVNDLSDFKRITHGRV
ncbi:hypothetical protein [Thermococcus barophilus]|uniref:hypothetical protein n=1 Tax=Thermococcus barophilus TaxID=55802 RepID=UPI0011AE57A6|nr:hypothetical protein [Thermococcus barophilus]